VRSSFPLRSKHVDTLGSIAFHRYRLTLNCARCCHRSTVDLDGLILANGPDYLLRRIVDMAVCSKCRGVEITVTVSVAMRPGFPIRTTREDLKIERTSPVALRSGDERRE
jgi:hypothetical protein